MNQEDLLQYAVTGILTTVAIPLALLVIPFVIIGYVARKVADALL